MKHLHPRSPRLLASFPVVKSPTTFHVHLDRHYARPPVPPADRAATPTRPLSHHVLVAPLWSQSLFGATPDTRRSGTCLEKARRSRLLYTDRVDELLDLDLLDDQNPFEIDAQAAHLFKHPHLGLDDVYDVWVNDPLFYPAKPPAHYLMVAEVAGTVLIVPIAPSRSGDPSKCRPIGCYEASSGLAATYRRDRDEY